MTEVPVSYTKGRIRLHWDRVTAEEQGREIARAAVKKETDVDLFIRLHFANALDGCYQESYDSFVHGFFNEMAVLSEHILDVHHVGSEVAREVWRAKRPLGR